MTDQELDELMRRVLIDAIVLNEENYQDEIPFKPSFGHRRQIMAMLANPVRWAKEKAKPTWKKVLQHAAVILLVAAIGFAGVMAASPTARATVIRWVAELYETHVVYRYLSGDAADEMQQYEITALPEGYTENREARIELPTQVDILYQNNINPRDPLISFSYIHIQQGSANEFILEGATVLPVTVNGQEGSLLLAKDASESRNVITWIDSENDIQFSIQGSVDETTLLRMAESVSLVKSSK